MEGSFSNTAIVCACLKEIKAKIKADISTVTYRITAGANDGHGVMPDYPLLRAAEDVVTGRDPLKSLALKLISER